MSQTTRAAFETTHKWHEQLTELSDEFYDLLIANTYLYDFIEEAFHQQARDNPEKITTYHGLLWMMQRLRAQSVHIDQIIEQLHLSCSNQTSKK